ncbi:MAG TPA: zinc-ribbon domain-containing protein [Methanoregula sp.]|nr:zinc-ribbon domain-containing protein [Methanoregula sp.]
MKFCGECGTENPDTNRFCKNCGGALRKPAEAPATQPAPAQPSAGVVQPQAAAVPAGTQPVPAAGETPKRTWLGIVALIPAILAWILYPVLLGIAAVLFGITSIALARKQGTRFPVAGVIAIIVGLLAIIVNIYWLDIFPPPQVLPPIR